MTTSGSVPEANGPRSPMGMPVNKPQELVHVLHPGRLQHFFRGVILDVQGDFLEQFVDLRRQALQNPLKLVVESATF